MFVTNATNAPRAPLAPQNLRLEWGLSFFDLYERHGLLRVDGAFLNFLAEQDAVLCECLVKARANPEALAPKAESELLIALAPHVDGFLGRLFGIDAELRALSGQHHALAPLYSVKRLFVQRRALHKVKPDQVAALDAAASEAALAAWFGEAFSELAYARHVAAWLKDEGAHAEQLDLATRYAAWAVTHPDGKRKHHGGVLFKAPSKLDFMRLVPVQTDVADGFARHSLPQEHLRRREGFALTDGGTDLAGALDHANYCIWCHEQGRDSCAKGIKEKAPASGFKKTIFGVSLAGCPLEEKISEFHKVKAQGQSLGALAMICVDNPMAAATGHRICNDCMKACIYQKQDPVNIPEAETRALKDVLELPWGFELYSLLTRWNPLNLRRPYPKAPSGKRVLVVGLGPAGFTLAHHLMNDGHTLVGIDGLKIEPLPGELCGVNALGARVTFQPVRDVQALYESLDDRQMAGFGGVAEYGITVRWNKNFLKLIRLLLERRRQFAMFGGVRFGGTLTVEDAWVLGFDHIALATGAGRPTVLEIPNGTAPGVRAASDFLMALQLTGAAKRDSIANLQIRLPAVVIGGGLTAIDTATESLAYYVVQVEKFCARYDALVAELGEAAVRPVWSREEAATADEFLAHARAIASERARAHAEQREPRILDLLKSWGGVTIAYRRRLIDSPSYTLNHEEVGKALEEGVSFAEGLTPLRVEVDASGQARAVSFAVQSLGGDGKWANAGKTELPARSVLVAAGTQPNTVLAREHPGHFVLDGKYFQACDEEGAPLRPERATSKPASAEVLLSRFADGRFISYFGDLHPSYFGNVVKAMGSAKQGFPMVSRVLERVAPASAQSDARFLLELNEALRPVVHEVKRLTPTIVEVVLRAPLAARRFEPGQFYRLQNFAALAARVEDTTLAMEGLGLTGAWVDKAQGLLSTIILEMGGSSDLCASLRPGEPVVLMGPTGAPTEIPRGETVLLAGGGLGNAVLFSIGQALRAAGSKVLYFAAYKRAGDRYKVEEIEKAADMVVWCCDEGPGFDAERVQDRAYVGNIVEAMAAYATGALGEPLIPLSACDRIIAIGSDRMMAAVARARHQVLQAHLKPGHFGIGSINSPMQCMMKEICAQCLQPHVDPHTGETSYVFSCFNQDQPLDRVDFGALAQRLRQNSVQEKLTALWIDRCLRGMRLRPERKVA
jgi:NADPH-dependent glutamate synthase beta subunit-like oxidoreductase/NAD(P)H-flavin reductase